MNTISAAPGGASIITESQNSRIADLVDPGTPAQQLQANQEPPEPPSMRRRSHIQSIRVLPLSSGDMLGYDRGAANPTSPKGSRPSCVSRTVCSLRSMGGFSHVTRRNHQAVPDWRNWVLADRVPRLTWHRQPRGKVLVQATPLSSCNLLDRRGTKYTHHHNNEQRSCLGSSLRKGSSMGHLRHALSLS
jgi:hypothetical protein